MMHVYDPNGELHKRQLRRQRQDNTHSIMLGIGMFCGLVVIACAVFVTLHLLGR